MFKRTTRGFTLIELLVVIAIIGILSSVVLASLNDARTKSRDAKRVADIKQMQLALELYFDSNGSYPAATSALAPNFIAVVPTDPTGGAAYLYEQLTSGTSYHLGASLEGSGHVALGSDSDITGTVVKGADATDCAGATNSRYCYDVKP